MTNIVCYIDWENIVEGLRESYNQQLPALEILNAIRTKVSEFGEVIKGVAYYGDHYQDEALLDALRYVGFSPRPVPSRKVKNNR